MAELQCVVCQESLWDAGDDGRHLPCSLRCGHMFGRPCIEMWIRRLGKASATCPLCSAACAIKDVWPVLVREPLRTVDASQVESAEQEYEGARAKRQALQREVGRAHMALARSRLELRKLQDRQQAACKRPAPSQRCDTPGVQPPTRCSDVARRVSTAAITGGRLLAFGVPGSASVLASVQTQPDVCGYARFSLHDVRHRMVALPHSKPVRGLVRCPHDGHDGLSQRVLTCSLDGTACVSSAQSANTLVTLDCRSPCWACEWDLSREHLVYVAVAARGEVLVFDLRRSSEPLCPAPPAPLAPDQERRPAAPSGPPFHSLVAVAAQPSGQPSSAEGALPSGAGLLCASQQAVVFCPFDCAGGLRPMAEHRPLALEGCQAVSVSFHAELNVGLASFRKASQGAELERGAVHALFARDGQQIGQMGGTTLRLALARSKLLVDGSRNAYVAAGDDLTCRPLLWSANSGRVVQELEQHEQPVLDIGQLQHSDVFAAASATRVDIYRLLSSRGAAA